MQPDLQERQVKLTYGNQVRGVVPLRRTLNENAKDVLYLM